MNCMISTGQVAQADSKSAQMATTHQLARRVPLVSPTSRGPVVNLVAWIAMTTMCLAVVTVVISKLVVARKLTWKDSLVVCAMLSAVAYTITINVQVEHGLGSPLRTLSTSEYNAFQAAGYAANIFFITGLFFGKASTLTLLFALAPNKGYRKPALAVGGFLLVWTIVSILASAFQCSPPRTWLYTTGKCFNQTTFWAAYATIDIITDIVIMCLPVLLLYKSQLAMSKKINVCFAFSFRVLAIMCAIFRLVELPKFFHRHDDVTLESWMPTIATILELFASIFATCVPHLRPFMESIQAGYLSGIEHDSNDARYAYGNGSYSMRKMSKSTGGTTPPDNAVEKKSPPMPNTNLPRQDEEDEVDRIGHAITSNERVRQNSHSSDGHRSNDSTGSKTMIIKTTKEWSVCYEDA